MARLLPLALFGLLLAGCADAPETTGAAPEASGETASGFDAQAWLAEAKGLRFDAEGSEMLDEASGDEIDDAGPDEAETLRAQALAAELDEAVGWRRACDTYIDENGAAVYEPTPTEGAHWARGTLDVGLITETEAVVAVTCDFGAYQGSYALVRIRGDRATLLRAPATDENGQPMDASETTFSTPSWDRLTDRVVTTFGRARGIGDCGNFITYALASGDEMELSEVRQRACGDTIPDDIPPPEAWPVVYTAE
ncbi:DUF1176 domain-containing protein [Rubricoccus marinus]|uniref:DUF1176 domain-containing protein n=1 Tax=Rubricoccus marinus TaxID=716817 RepID=A0A259TWF2_9BACT|nr:DUF1176 domain-containing protein [Rubricoccus marinus]OZC02099.1 hypothetical protein BSZ36_03330 [Rubricoccus marinus]